MATTRVKSKQFNKTHFTEYIIKVQESHDSRIVGFVVSSLALSSETVHGVYDIKGELFSQAPSGSNLLRY